MSSLLFYLFSALALGSAIAVVLNRNVVNAAMCLLLSLLGVAGVFVMLDAALLAVLLVLVYAGAVVALFLFIVMLLDVQRAPRKPFKLFGLASTVLAVALLGLGFYSFITHGQVAGSAEMPAAFAGGLKEYGAKLFTTYMLPVQVVGFLLLVAMLGVIVLSKKFDEKETAK